MLPDLEKLCVHNMISAALPVMVMWVHETHGEVGISTNNSGGDNIFLRGKICVFKNQKRNVMFYHKV